MVPKLAPPPSCSDLSWSFTEPHLLASCAIDSFVHVWDIRYAISGMQNPVWGMEIQSIDMSELQSCDCYVILYVGRLENRRCPSRLWVC